MQVLRWPAATGRTKTAETRHAFPILPLCDVRHAKRVAGGRSKEPALDDRNAFTRDMGFELAWSDNDLCEFRHGGSSFVCAIFSSLAFCWSVAALAIIVRHSTACVIAAGGVFALIDFFQD
jgi:hypothetical protein